MNLFNDVLSALHSMRHNLRFTALTVGVMTIGLTLCIFMFSFLYNTLYVPLPFDSGDRLRLVVNKGVNWGGFRIHDFEDMTISQDSFEIFDAYSGANYTFSQGGKVYQEQGFHVSDKFFTLTGVKPLLGRTFQASDLAPGAPNVILITEKMWRASFSSDEQVVGKNLMIGEDPYLIIGVIPHVRFPNSGNLYLPLKTTGKGLAREQAPMVSVYGRLKSNLDDQQAQADIVQILNNIRAVHPGLNANVQAEIITFQQNWLPLPRNMILPMQICVVLILLLSSVNVANLMFSRSLDRKKEIAIRAAIGATRQSVFSHVLMESVLVCFFSGLLALVLSDICIGLCLEQLSKSYRASEAPMWWQFSLTTNTVVMGLIITLLTAIVTGVLPALRSAFADINAALRDGTRGAQSKLSAHLSRAIIILEVALSCALLIPSIALMYTVHDKNTMSYGANMDGAFTALIEFPNGVTQYATDQGKLNYLRRMETVLEQNSAIEQVTFAQMLPLTWVNLRQFALENTDAGPDHKYPEAVVNSVSNDYFDTMGVRLLEGRLFDSADRETSQRVAIITPNFANQHFPAGDYMGKKVRIIDGEGNNDWHLIVGLVNDVIHGVPSSRAKSTGSIFISIDQNPVSFLTMVVKSSLQPAQLSELVATEAFKQDSNYLAPYRYATSEQLKARSLAFIDFLGMLFTAFAIASVVLAFSGIYGVMSHSIVQKTQEVGIRRALGANNTTIARHFLSNAGILLTIGLAAGVPGGISLNHVLQQSGLVESYPAVFVVIPLLISAIILIAVLVPIGRTLRMEPIDALRYE